ncbi:copper chaperone PCu(A)C [Hahella sp. SMD15-11]|uniref:Copper chaperone PCu(A)C n=1 Tax=Thermohahella caldifontis TaxID=3142973 RepID=A0AB39UZ96_9GAMM
MRFGKFGMGALALVFTLAWTVTVHAASLEMTDGWVRMPLPGKTMTAAYLTVRNTGDRVVTLVGATSPDVRKIELHTMTMKDGVMHMTRIEGGVTLAPGAEHVFRPGGDHLMLFGLRAPASGDDRLVLNLELDDGSSVPLSLPWRAADLSGHGMKH